MYLEMINSPMISLLEQGKVREAKQALREILEKGQENA
jgi:pentatricopeptide repeat protein